MSSTNQSPFYKKAEQAYLNATTDEERLYYLEEMIREAPKHKSSEKMLANLKSRLRKLKERVNERKKSGKKGFFIKKGEMQCVLAGMANTGKSMIFSILTGVESNSSEIPYSTEEPKPGTMRYEDVQIQMIDEPSFPKHDKNTLNSADVILIVVDNLDHIKESEKYLEKARGKRIVVFNKIDLLSEQERRKVEATLKSKFRNYSFLMFSKDFGDYEINEFKKGIFSHFDIVRVYTKEPRKEASDKPMILKEGATVEDVANKIRKGFAESVKQIKIWGPSAKFSGQIVGFNHKLKDKDVVEFKTK